MLGQANMHFVLRASEARLPHKRLRALSNACDVGIRPLATNMRCISQFLNSGERTAWFSVCPLTMQLANGSFVGVWNKSQWWSARCISLLT